MNKPWQSGDKEPPCGVTSVLGPQGHCEAPRRSKTPGSESILSGRVVLSLSTSSAICGREETDPGASESSKRLCLIPVPGAREPYRVPSADRSENIRGSRAIKELVEHR